MIQKLEKYLETAEKKQKLMIFATFFLCLFFIGKEYIPTLLEQEEQLQASIEETQRKISQRSINSLKKQITVNKQEILKQKELLSQEKEDINYVMGNIYKIKYASFNEQIWARTLDLVLKKSKNNSLEISSMKSTSLQNTGTDIVKAKKLLKIEGIGNFKDILDFINYLSSLDVLLVIKNSSLALENSKVRFNIELETYGVGL